MITAEQIPPEVVEAAAIDAYFHNASWLDAAERLLRWKEWLKERDRAVYRSKARAALAAALNAWTGATDKYPGDGTPCLILPLQQEPRDG